MRPLLPPNLVLAVRGQAGHRGFTLIELLVAVAIALGLTLVITTMLIRSESGRRSLTSVNDASGNGAHLSFMLDRTLRSAGSGYSQAWKLAYGCPLRVARSGTTILPRGSAFPAPFSAVATGVRIAPLVVQAGIGAGGSDVLIVHTGASGLGESPQPVLPGSSTSTNLRVPSTIGLRAGDLVALLQDGGTCLVQQVATGFVGSAGQQLDFGDAYYSGTIDSVTLASIGWPNAAVAAPLGNITGNRPSFQLLGIGNNNTLFSYDLLRLDGTDTVVPVADSVVNLRARYGVDTDDNGVVDTWVDPAVAPWNAATLLNGTLAAQTNLSRIVAVRLALVMRNTSPEREDVSPATLVLFSDMASALQLDHNIAAADRVLRHRVMEFTVPLRNATMTARP